MPENPSIPHDTVVPLRLDDADAIGAVLARAFHDDPIKVVTYPNEARRAAVLPVLFTVLIRAMAASGGHLTTTPDTSAAALWNPPGTRLSALSMLRGYGRDFPRIVARTPIVAIPVLARVFGTMARRRKALMPEPHWYLAVLGVDPSRQGQGLGTMLVRDGLDRADADGVPAYLETETEENVAFYRGLGFRVLEELTFDRYGVRLWLMARDPEPAGS